MKEYQEALNELTGWAITGFSTDIEIIKALTHYNSLIQELVDKAIPKKPNMENLNYVCCPSCGLDEIELYDYYGNEVKLKHCNNCGQAIDWSKDD